MADLLYYYYPAQINAAATLSSSSSNQYVSELQFQTFLTSNNSELASLSNLATETYNELESLRTDGIIESLLSPITTAAGDALAELLSQYVLNNPSVQNALQNLTDGLFGTAAQAAESNLFEPDVSNPTPPAVQPSFLSLSSNVFALERGGTVYGYGTTVANDFNLLTGNNLNILSPNYIYNSVYGASYSNSMSTARKQTILNTTTLTATLCNVVASSSVNTSNLSSSNVSANTMTSPFVAFSNANAYNTRTSNVYSSNAFMSNLMINGNAAVNGQTVLTNNLPANPSSLTINSNQASITAAGAAEFFQVNVGGSALQINPSGDTYVNGVKVIDGSANSVVVYEDQIKQSGERYQVDAVLSGNLGSIDTSLFPVSGSSLPQNVLDAPQSFQDLANRKVIQQIVNGIDVSQWWI